MSVLIIEDKVRVSTFPYSHHFHCLLSHFLMFLVSLITKQYGPRSDCSLKEQSDQGS